LIKNKEKLCEMAQTPLNEHCFVVLLKKLPEKLGDPGKFLIPCDFPGMAECLALVDLGARINLMPYSMWKSDITAKRIDVIDMASEEYSQEVLVISFWKRSMLLLSKMTSSEFYLPYLDPDGYILLLEAFLNDDPLLPPSNQRNYLPEVRKELKICEAHSEKSSVNEPPVSELKELPPHLNMHSWNSHKRAIAWKLSNIKGINPEFCTHKILMEEDFEPAVQHQSRVNPKIHDVIKQEVIKLLEAGLIYPISDSPWVTPVHCVPKKGGFIVVENEDNELISTRLVTRWRVCIDYHKLNEATRKDHFPLLFMDQMLERLAGNQYYCFLDGFLVISKFPSIPKIRRKPHLPAHTERLLIAACLLGYAMLQARFRGV
nr:reverse transcriptase domain-containing protein [Tanacetum cinerariifolium]